MLEGRRAETNAPASSSGFRCIPALIGPDKPPHQRRKRSPGKSSISRCHHYLKIWAAEQERPDIAHERLSLQGDSRDPIRLGISPTQDLRNCAQETPTCK